MLKIKHIIKHISYLTLFELKELFRYKTTIFWNFLLPFILLLTLGFIFGDDKSYLYFLLPGIIGINIVSISLFSVGTNLASYKEQNVLKRLALLPITKWEYVIGHVLARTSILLLQAFFILVLGNLIFGIHFFENIFSLFVIIFLGIIIFSTLGVALASITNRAETTSALANVIFFPMLFFSGAYIPIEKIPSFLHPIVYFLPLTHFILPFREVFIGNFQLKNYFNNFMILFIWFFLSFIIAVKKFKWSDEV